MFNYQPVFWIGNTLMDHHRVWARRYIQPFAILMNSISTFERTEYCTHIHPCFANSTRVEISYNNAICRDIV